MLGKERKTRERSKKENKKQKCKGKLGTQSEFNPPSPSSVVEKYMTSPSIPERAHRISNSRQRPATQHTRLLSTPSPPPPKKKQPKKISARVLLLSISFPLRTSYSLSNLRRQSHSITTKTTKPHPAIFVFFFLPLLSPPQQLPPPTLFPFAYAHLYRSFPLRIYTVTSQLIPDLRRVFDLVSTSNRISKRFETMAGGKGKSSGGKSSGGKTSVDGPKKQQSHSARAGLQVRCKCPDEVFSFRVGRRQCHATLSTLSALSSTLLDAPRCGARSHTTINQLSISFFFSNRTACTEFFS